MPQGRMRFGFPPSAVLCAARGHSGRSPEADRRLEANARSCGTQFVTGTSGEVRCFADMSGRQSFLLALCLTLVGGCGLVPRDIAGTRERVENSHVIRVGLQQGSLSGDGRARAVSYLDRLGHATGAQPQITTGAAEPLLVQLQEGELDLVLGEVAADSPWVSEVAVVEPLIERQLADRVIGLSPIARNGENRWIMLLETTVRDMRSGT